jgi:hypothetical protein
VKPAVPASLNVSSKGSASFSAPAFKLENIVLAPRTVC